MDYNTPLSEREKPLFKQWATGGERDFTRDMEDYDMQGWWLNERQNGTPQGDQHFIDRFKKPNHPTFSTESQYSNDETPGGQWNTFGDNKEKWNYTPSEWQKGQPNYREKLGRYFEWQKGNGIDSINWEGQ